MDSTPNLPKTQETIHQYNDNFKQYSFDVQTVVDVLIDVQTVVNKFQSFYRVKNSTLQTNKCNPSLSVCLFPIIQLKFIRNKNTSGAVKKANQAYNNKDEKLTEMILTQVRNVL